MSHPLVLLIHGVNSTGEWHETTTKECRGVFDCHPVKYRHYHGLTGPIKVYVWPTAALSILGLCAALLLENPLLRHFAVLGVLGVAFGLVVYAEYEWSRRAVIALPPILLLVIGFIGAIADPLAERLRLAIPLGAIVALSLYLDLREYGHPRVSIVQACAAALAALAIATWGAAYVLEHPEVAAWTLAGLACLAALEPWIRRRAAFRCVRRQIDEARKRQPCPHVVAHSLGTYVLGHLVNEDERFFLGRAIFTGCVLDRSFPWHDNVGPDTIPKLRGVKNYVGKLDLVPMLTGLLRATWVALTAPVRVPGVNKATHFVGAFVRWRPLGRAGQGGFHDRALVVHSQAADTICGHCAPAASAPVHNVRARFAGHSTLNQDPDYQCFQWLPFFWGDSPDKFDYWKEICRIGDQAAKELAKHDPNVVTPALLELQTAFGNAERQLLKGPWYWPLTTDGLSQAAHGRTLAEYLEELRELTPAMASAPASAKLLKRIPALIFAKFFDALQEKRQPAPRPEVTALLEPRKVFMAAVAEAITKGP